jgi:S-(hydroxymethyl)glutathione dehydrogenase / alcohol dehydrogenase
MKALFYDSSNDAQIDDKPPSRIQSPEDVILRVTSTVIYGSDLHPYHGTVHGMQPGQTLGHEFIGIVKRRRSRPEVHEVIKGGN